MKFKETQVNISDLLLDPNNPRLVSDLNKAARVPDSDLDNARAQEELLGKFQNQRSNDESEQFTQIKTLYESMMQVGNVPIDRIVIRSIDNSEKFLVIEGNRRTATLKKIIKELNIARDNGTPLLEQEIRRDSYEKFDCILLDTQGMSEKDIAENISLVLGLRHHGSLKEWGPLPRAYDIFKQYMADPLMKGSDFTFLNGVVKNVAEKTSIEQNEVRANLLTYRVYDQLREVFPADIKPHHYSLIRAAVTNNNLSQRFITTDEISYQLDERSISNVNKILEFEERDHRIKNNNPKDPNIIPTPAALAKLGQIYNLKSKNSEIVEEQADGLLAELYAREGEDQSGQPELHTVEKILDLVKATIQQNKWTKSIQNLIKKREESLEISNFTNAGNEAAQKDKLKRALRSIRALMDVED